MTLPVPSKGFAFLIFGINTESFTSFLDVNHREKDEGASKRGNNTEKKKNSILFVDSILVPAQG